MATNHEPPPPVAAFIRERRVRFTVTPEKVINDGAAIPVGFDVRLFAWHGLDSHALQGCPVCAALEEQLREVAELSVGAGEKPTEVEIAPDYAMLYDSKVLAGTDDVALDVRLLRWGDDEHPAGKIEETYLKQVRARLKALGVREC
jgi:hypothetical protein